MIRLNIAVYKQKNIPYLLILPVTIVCANTDPIISLDRPSIYSSTLFELRRTLGMHGRVTQLH